MPRNKTRKSVREKRAKAQQDREKFLRERRARIAERTAAAAERQLRLQELEAQELEDKIRSLRMYQLRKEAENSAPVIPPRML